MNPKKPDQTSGTVIDIEDKLAVIQNNIAIHREEEQYKQLYDAVDSALDDTSEKYEPGTHDEWATLKRTAKFNFPQLAHPRYKTLSPKQKLCAIADAEGWSQERIEDLSKVPRSTIRVWLKRPDVQMFSKDYSQATGSGSPQAKFNSLAFQGTQIIESILSMPAQTADILRIKLDAIKWVSERAYGPAGKVATEGLDPVKLAKAASEMKAKIAKLDDSALADLFAEDTKPQK
jgi:hypothetical protein